MNTSSLPFDTRYVRHGFIMLVLAFSSGFAIRAYHNPRTGLAAHVIGILSGLFIVALGFVLPSLKLAPWQRACLYWPLLISMYLGFITQVLAAVVGLTRMFWITAAQQPPGPEILEVIVQVIVMAITPVLLIACLFVIHGLRR